MVYLLSLLNISITDKPIFDERVLLAAPAFFHHEMKLAPPSPVTPAELRSSTFAFSMLASALSIPLLLLQPPDLLSSSSLELIVAASLFWGFLSLFAFHYFWDMYYQFIYPNWFRRLGGVNFILYAVIAWGMGSIIRESEISTVLLFLLLGGLEGVLEHIIGIYALDVVNQVPWLHGLKTVPILLFSFVEYVVYWSIVLWISLVFQVLI
jgi:hypothetical protein